MTVILAGCQAEEKPTEKKAENTQAKVEETKAEKETISEEPSQPEDKKAANDSAPDTAAEESQAENHQGHEHAAAPSGERYQKLESDAACEEPVVIEFFAYHCPHCYALEPSAEKWRAKNGGKVKFLSVPTTLGHDQLGSLLLVHHAAKLLGVLEKTQHALFERFHKEKKLFASEDEAAEFLAAQGADKAEALAMLKNQDEMMKSINEDFELLKQYRISSVPQVLINHQYMTNITAAGGHDEVFEVVDETLQLANNCGTK
nr:thiol:disulfide interchange protein DsbA/DsbL [Aliikangiella sp. G2MR2-5]